MAYDPTKNDVKIEEDGQTLDTQMDVHSSKLQKCHGVHKLRLDDSRP